MMSPADEGIKKRNVLVLECTGSPSVDQENVRSD